MKWAHRAVALACSLLGILPDPAPAAPPQASGAPASARDVRGLLEKASRAIADQDLRAAIGFAESAERESARLRNPRDPLRIQALMTLAELRGADAIAARDFARAKIQMEYAVKVSHDFLPRGDPARVRSALGLAELLLAMGDDRGAVARYEGAAEECSGFPDLGPGRVRALMMAAHLGLERDGPDPPAVARLAAEARRLHRADPKGSDAALRMVALQVWQRLLGRAQDAAGSAANADVAAIDERLRRDLDRSRALLEQAGAGPGLTAGGPLWLLKFRYDRRRVDQAEETLAQLAKTAWQLRSDPDFLAEYWSYVGLLKTERGDYAAARAAHEAELRLRREHRLGQVFRTLNSLGLLLLRLGDYRAAGEVLEEAVGIYATDPLLKNDPLRPVVLSQLAKALEGAGQVEEAARLLREALALAEGSPRPDPYTLGLCRNNLGANRLAAGDVDAARGEFEQARKIAANAFGEGHVTVAEVDVNLGWVALARGEASEAESRFRAASKSIGAAGKASRRHAEVLAYLARPVAQVGRAAEARGLLEEALALREASLRDALRLALSERERLAIVQELRFHPESRRWPGALDAYLDLGPAIGADPDAQYARLLTWKGAMARQARPRAEALEEDPEVRRMARELDETARALRAASNQKGPGMGGSRSLDRTGLRTGAAERLGAAGQAANPGDLGVLVDRFDDLERRLRARSPRFAGGGDASAATPGDVRAAIPPGWALLDVIEIQSPGPREAGDGRRYLAYLLRPDRPILRLDLGDTRPIDRAVRAFHLAIASPDDEYTGPARQLAGLLRDPLLPHLDGVSGLVVAGDGLLHRLPLAALPGAKPGSFWVEEMAFAAVPSAQSLVARRKAGRPASAGALVVGDVDYGPLVGEYGPLPMTGPEAGAVVQAFREGRPSAPVDHLVRLAAGEMAVKSLLPGRRFVHLATHGFFHAGPKAESSSDTFGFLAQLDSGLVLAPGTAKVAGDPDDDQLLTAEEVGRLDLRGVGLVVLSACSSGLGHISSGQGVIGLLGAFDRAGVGSVVCSLWKVNDAATAALMVAFYRHLWQDRPPLGPARALRAAQLDLIRGTPGVNPPPYAHPQFWAGFVVSGDPEGSPEAGPR